MVIPLKEQIQSRKKFPIFPDILFSNVHLITYEVPSVFGPISRNWQFIGYRNKGFRHGMAWLRLSVDPKHVWMENKRMCMNGLEDKQSATTAGR